MKALALKSFFHLLLLLLSNYISGRTKHRMGPYGHRMGTVWDCMGQYGHLWNRMGPYGTVWALMKPYGHLWDRMGTYGTVWAPYETVWALMGLYGHRMGSY